MKKLFFMLAAGSLFVLASCKSSDKKTDGGETSVAQKNLAAAQTISNAFRTGDVTAIDSVVAVDFVDHTDRGDVTGRDSLKQIIQMVQSMQMKMELVKEMANDTHVFQWLRFSGNSDGSMGMPPGPFDFTEIEVIRFQDGKAVEHWAMVEPRVMMRMMPGMPGDTAKFDPGVPTATEKSTAGVSTDKSKKNLASMHGVVEMFKSGDLSKTADYMADDVVDWGAENSPNKGIANVKKDFEKVIGNMSGVNMEVMSEVADDEFVMSWMKMSGTMKQDGWGKKAGEKYEGAAIEVARYNADGKCVEHWTFIEMREMMKMMGGGDSNKLPPPPPVKDTTNK